MLHCSEARQGDLFYTFLHSTVNQNRIYRERSKQRHFSLYGSACSSGTLACENPVGTDVISLLLEKVETEAAGDAVKTSDEIADLIDARANAEEMLTPRKM